MVKNYTTQELLKKVRSLKSFTIIPNGYWILGVRSKADLHNQFDDKFYLFKGEVHISVMSGTTNPGASGLLNFAQWDKRGVAVIKANKWYYNVWTRGLHNSKVIAYRQTGPFDVIRDNDKNKRSGDSGTTSVEYGRGLNFHPSTYNLQEKNKKTAINGWSVGCQVVNDIPAYNKLMELTKSQAVMTYCLIDEF